MIKHNHDEFYPPEESPGNAHFNQIIALHDSKDLEWEKIQLQAPLLPRGWFELGRLPQIDRIEFTRDYWLTKLPCHELESRFEHFFESIEEISIFLTQQKSISPFEAHMVYSLKNENGFFHGSPPASVDSITNLQSLFGTLQLPVDYLAFLEIHDGFNKYMDTGLIKTRSMARCYQRLQQLLEDEILIGPDGQVMSPDALIPFYESAELHSYQCFYAEWHPSLDMGNVYFSEEDRSVSNFLDYHHLEENLAFPTFLKWLLFYLDEHR